MVYIYFVYTVEFELLQPAIQCLSNPFVSSSLGGKTGMIVAKQSRQKQRVVIEFLLSEGETALNVSRRLE